MHPVIGSFLLQAPLADLFSRQELGRASPANKLRSSLLRVHELWDGAGGERSLGTSDLACFVPVPGLGSWSWQVRTTSLVPLATLPCSV